MNDAYIVGLGFWSPGFADVEAWRSQTPDESTKQPPCKAVGSRLKRGISQLTRMSVEVMCQAGAHAGFDLATCPTVFGSAYGEMQIAIHQLQMMREDDGVISPARFKNSVHNTAAGLFSIAHKNRGFTTAIAAGSNTVPLTLLEALLCVDDEGHVLASVADETLPDPLGKEMPYGRFAALGVGFALSGKPGPAPLARLQNLRTAPRSAPSSAQYPSLSKTPSFLKNPSSPGLELLNAVLDKRSGTLQLSHEPHGPLRAEAPAWVVDLAVP